MRLIFYIGAFIASSILALTTGCASGGFKLTREYARWVNSQMIILRIILYILTSVVFAVTLIIDLVIFNTIDFWQGRVSGGNYDFVKGDRSYAVLHEMLPTGLKRSTIQIKDLNQKLLQVVVLNETSSGQIELFVDGTLRTRVDDISTIPVATMFDKKGNPVEKTPLWFLLPAEKSLASIQH